MSHDLTRHKGPASMDHDGHSVIEPVRELAERVLRGGTARDADSLIAQAEQNLAGLKKEFPAWMATEFEGVEQAWKLYKEGAPDSQRLLFRKLHDMRGQAATFGFPLAGRAADNLCKLMDAIEEVPFAIIEAHVQTVRVIIRDNVNVEDHPIGVQMVKELEKLGHGLIQQVLRTDKGAGRFRSDG